MEEALVARLRANAGLAGIVGDHVDWLERPKGDELPGVTLRMIAPGNREGHDGAFALSSPRIQVDCWGKNYLQAKQVARALKAAIEPEATVAGVNFKKAFQVGERDGLPVDIPGGGKAVGITMDFIVWWKRV